MSQGTPISRPDPITEVQILGQLAQAMAGARGCSFEHALVTATDWMGALSELWDRYPPVLLPDGRIDIDPLFREFAIWQEWNPAEVQAYRDLLEARGGADPLSVGLASVFGNN